MNARIAVIGAGGWATRHHLPALARDDRATIAAVIDADASRARAAADAFAARGAATSIDEILTHGSIDGAIVVTPHTTHAAIVTALLSAGVATLVEKPLAVTAAEAFALVRLAESSATPLSVGYTAQYTPAAAAVRTWIGERVGELQQIVVEFSSRAGSLYAATDPMDSLSAYSAASGGGQATTQLSHALGAIAWTTGSEFSEVAAFVNTRGTAVDVDDVVAFRLSDGTTGTAASTGGLPTGLPMRHAVRYIAERGIVEHDLLFSRARLDLLDGASEQVAPGHLDPPYPAAAPVHTFLDLLHGGPNPAPVRPAAAAVAAIEAVLASAASGTVVHVPALPTDMEWV